MGNRTGSPPEQYRDDEDDEQSESQPETDDTQQTEIEDVTQPEHDDEETPKEGSDIPDASEESRDSGGVGGGVINVSTGSEPDEQQPEDDDSEKVEHSGTEGKSEPESDEQTDTEDDEFKFVYGDIVHDRETNPSENENWEDMVVVNLPDNTIDDWNCGDAETLADRNPGYPHTDSVVVGVALEALSVEVPRWDKRQEEIPLETLDDDSIDYSCYPSLRLKLEEPSHLRTL